MPPPYPTRIKQDVKPIRQRQTAYRPFTSGSLLSGCKAHQSRSFYLLAALDDETSFGVHHICDGGNTGVH
jgi:hypothetical protein